MADHPGRCQCPWLPRHAAWLACSAVGCASRSQTCLPRSAWRAGAEAQQTIPACIATSAAPHAHPCTGRKGMRCEQRLQDTLAADRASSAHRPCAGSLIWMPMNRIDY